MKDLQSCVDKAQEKKAKRKKKQSELAFMTSAGEVCQMFVFVRSKV